MKLTKSKSTNGTPRHAPSDPSKEMTGRQRMLTACSLKEAEKAKRLIDDCAYGGGFVLSTGDQCGRDTPDANLFKLVEVAETYGRY